SRTSSRPAAPAEGSPIAQDSFGKLLARPVPGADGQLEAQLRRRSDVCPFAASMSERRAGLDLRVQTLRFPGGRRDRVRGPSGRQATTAANAAALVEQVFADWLGTLYVYEEYQPEEAEANVCPVGKASSPSAVVESRRKKRTTLEKAWPGALILDVTSKGEEPWVRFSPFYPHGGIPVPNSPGTFAQSGEGLWQGLKVFEREDIDPSRWQITSLRGIKRAGRSRGKVLGHRFGTGSD